MVLAAPQSEPPQLAQIDGELLPWCRGIVRDRSFKGLVSLGSWAIRHQVVAPDTRTPRCSRVAVVLAGVARPVLLSEHAISTTKQVARTLPLPKHLQSLSPSSPERHNPGNSIVPLRPLSLAPSSSLPSWPKPHTAPRHIGDNSPLSSYRRGSPPASEASHPKPRASELQVSELHEG